MVLIFSVVGSSVPEPLSTLGTLTAAGLSVALRRRQKGLRLGTGECNFFLPSSPTPQFPSAQLKLELGVR
jgi:hypothetical protein